MSVSIQFSPALGLSNMDPVSRAVAGTAEATLFDKGFEHNRLVVIVNLPIARQALGNACQDLGGEVLGVDPGKNEEAGVVYDQIKITHLLLIGPADEPVARGDFPRSGSEAQRYQKMRAAKDQVPDLCAR